jgi:hypothetical protein
MKSLTLSTFSVGLAGILAAAALTPAPAIAANSASSTITANAVAAIAISKTTDLNFGYWIPCDGSVLDTGTYITVTPAGARSLSGSTCGHQLSPGGTVSGASFAVSGAPNATYSVTLPGTVVLLSLSNLYIYVQTFASLPAYAGTLDGAGSQTLRVGGTILLQNNAGFAFAPGQYSNVFPVTVSYN